MAVFIAKTFKASMLIEDIFAAIPVLAQSHFHVYFSPLFFFGFAY